MFKCIAPYLEKKKKKMEMTRARRMTVDSCSIILHADMHFFSDTGNDASMIQGIKEPIILSIYLPDPHHLPSPDPCS